MSETAPLKHRINEYHPHNQDANNNGSSDQIIIESKIYNESTLLEFETSSISEALQQVKGAEKFNLWMDVSGIHKDVVYKIGKQFDIHKLFIDDILSLGQRPKLDDIEDHMLIILLPIVNWNPKTKKIEKSQLSIVFNKSALLTFHPNKQTSTITQTKAQFRNNNHPLRSRKTDFLLYLLIDAVVDDYFNVLDEISEEIEHLEEQLSTKKLSQNYLDAVSKIRKEVFIMKRSINPVRDIINALYMKESSLIDPRNQKYFKDVLDHIILAIEYNENYRESTVNLQDLYMSQLNTKTNEVMKTLTIVTTLMAPAMLIASIYGMNFENMPLLYHPKGFFAIIVTSIIAGIGMMYYFKKKNWY